MEAMIQQLKKAVVDQASYLECIEKRFESARKAEFTEENCNDLARLCNMIGKESARLQDLKQSLSYLRRAAGHKDIDVFNPEKF